MNSTQFLRAGLLISAGLFSAQAAQAALFDRGGGLIYDDVLDVTWLQDANYAATTHYVTPDGRNVWSSGGAMQWDEARTWAVNLSYFDSVRGVTYDDWRLPTMIDTGEPGCGAGLSQAKSGGTDCGWNVKTYDSSTGTVYSEMAYMYYVNLSLTPLFNTDGSHNPTTGIPGGGQTYVGYVGLFQGVWGGGNGIFWSGLEFAPTVADSYAWLFSFDDGGYQGATQQSSSFHAWAVRDGDVAAVPEPETYALMLAGLGLVGFAARKRAAA